MLISLVVYCLLGAIAGVLAGLLGVGGGIVIVPMLVFAFGWQNFPPDVLMLMALGTSMGSIMFTSISSSLAHSRNKGVQWDAVRNITPGILIGTFCGSFLASHVPARFLQLFFVAFLFFVITQMLSGKKPKPSRHLPGLGGMSVAGGIIGVVSSLVGIGGGTLSVPFLLWNNLDMRKAIGTSAAIGFPIALAGCFGYIVNGWNAANLPPYSFGYIYLPSLFGIVVVSMFTAPLGARLAQTLPVPRPDAALLWWDGRYWLSVPGNAEAELSTMSAILLIVIGIRMLLKAL